MSNPSENPAPVKPAAAVSVPPAQEEPIEKTKPSSGKARVWFRDPVSGVRKERKID